MATIRDVAQRAGVSTATVSRVLAGVTASPGSRDRVLAAAQALNFRPNGVARSLRSTGTNTVGLVVSDLLNPYFTELARAVEDTARAAGFAVIVGRAPRARGAHGGWACRSESLRERAAHWHVRAALPRRGPAGRGNHSSRTVGAASTLATESATVTSS